MGPLACDHAWTIRAEVARRAGEKWCLCGTHCPDTSLGRWGESGVSVGPTRRTLVWGGGVENLGGRSRVANEEVTRRKGDNGKRIRYPLLLNS